MKRLQLVLLCLGALIFFGNPSSGQPNSSFTVNRYNVCNGTTITLNNTSTNANAYEWKIEGIHYSFSRDTVATLIEPCYDLQEIRLIASDTLSGLSDSSSVVVEVFDTCYFHWTGDFLMCPGDTVSLAVNPEEISTQFVINQPYTLLSGCLTCPSIEFILTTTGTSVDRTSTYFGGCTEVTTYDYLCTLGTSDLAIKEKVNVFPNPAQQNVIIEAEHGIKAVKIFNALGQLILESEDIHNTKTGLDISGLANGIYFIEILFDAGKSVQRKIIKSTD